MKKAFHLIFKGITIVRFIPLILFFSIFRNRRGLTIERDRWYDVIFPGFKKNFKLFIALLNLPEYRSVLYYRIGTYSRLIQWIAKGQSALIIQCTKIDCGLVIQHGHSTIIGAKSIGKNCQIWQNVTVGTNKSHSGNFPTIGNNVRICAGSIVIGNITIGDNVIIGAGSVVVKDIPANSVVVGNPAKVIRTIY